MKLPYDAELLRIFVGESDRHEGKPLYEAITHKIDTNGRPTAEPTAQEIIDLYQSNNP